MTVDAVFVDVVFTVGAFAVLFGWAVIDFARHAGAVGR